MLGYVELNLTTLIIQKTIPYPLITRGRNDRGVGGLDDALVNLTIFVDQDVRAVLILKDVRILGIEVSALATRSCDN